MSEIFTVYCFPLNNDDYLPPVGFNAESAVRFMHSVKDLNYVVRIIDEDDY